MPRFISKSPSTTPTAPAIPSRLSPTVRPPEPPAPAPLTPQEIALFERFKQFEAQRLAPIKVEHVEHVQPTPPSAKTIRMRQLFKDMETDSGCFIRSARAFKEIRDEELWRDSLPDFKAACREKLMQPNWVEQMIDSIPIWESLQPGHRQMVDRSSVLDALGKFASKDRNRIVATVLGSARTSGNIRPEEIVEAAKRLNLKPEGTK